MLFYHLMRLSFPTTARAPSAQKLMTSTNAQQPPSAKSYFRQHSTMHKTSKPSVTSYTRSSSTNTARNSPMSRSSNTPKVRRDSGTPSQQRKCIPSTKRYSSWKTCFTTSRTPASATHGQQNATYTTPLATYQQNACPSSSQLSNPIVTLRWNSITAHQAATIFEHYIAPAISYHAPPKV